MISGEKLKAARPELIDLKPEVALFAEVSYEVLIASSENIDQIRDRYKACGGDSKSLHHLGVVGGSRLSIDSASSSGDSAFGIDVANIDVANIDVAKLKSTYQSGWTEAFPSLSTKTISERMV